MKKTVDQQQAAATQHPDAAQEALPKQRASCEARPHDTECPSCGLAMGLWAGFYRCRNCGYKESCCF